MRDARAEKVADILTEYSLPLEPGQTAFIESSTAAEPLVLAIYERCLKRGAHVLLKPSFAHASPIFFEHANGSQLDYVWETDRWIWENIDARFAIRGAVNSKQLTNVDSAKQARASKAAAPLMETFLKRSAEKSLRWCVSLFPTEADAIDAAMSLRAYEDFFYSACLIDAADPIAEWRRMGVGLDRIKEWLGGRKEVHIEGEGTDLRLEVGGRTFIPCAGDYNFPDGEIFTGPVENRTRGVVSFSFPAQSQGKSVEGIRLEFEAGRVVKASARTNQDFLLAMLDADDGSRVLGELGIGTNYGIAEFSGSTLLDEKIGGTVHLALGASYPESGGLNKSAIHWDMVCDLRAGGRITVDGEPLMEDGKLLV